MTIEVVHICCGAKWACGFGNEEVSIHMKYEADDDPMFECRLDQLCANHQWRQIFADCKVKNLTSAHFDHSPLFLDPGFSLILMKVLCFIFENKWVRETRRGEIIKKV